ncbi:zf-MYND domain containing protein [Asbolus verrucosus]|uniref:Zf-MYND domain containing protein n=1 Tax=Asbolus verrucosus TaxID=1661398 RepID=A0A482W948_ASBVE|nr:zf-MYND domain containing protein [Asbolus verrucosus]
MRCARCKSKIYCSREHQKKDWKEHRAECSKLSLTQESPMPKEGSGESAILNSLSDFLSPHLDLDKTSTEKALRSAKTAMPISGENIVHPKKSGVKDFPEISFKQSPWSVVHKDQRNDLDEICRNVIQDMDAYGVCLVDNFLGEAKGKAVLLEVLQMYTKGVFKDGQLVSSRGSGDLKTIRGDRITWIDGNEECCSNIKQLISQVDAVIMRANKMVNNGKLGLYNINGRTKVSLKVRVPSVTKFVPARSRNHKLPQLPLSFLFIFIDPEPCRFMFINNLTIIIVNIRGRCLCLTRFRASNSVS